MSTATYSDVEDAQCIVVVNSNLDEEHFTVDVLTKRALRKGGKVIHIAPEASRVSYSAEVFLQCKPGTQTLVVHAIVKELAASGAVSLEDHPELGTHLEALSEARVVELTGVELSLIREAAEILKKSILKVVVFNKDYRGMRLAQDERLFSEAAEAIGASYLAMREKANMQGLLDMGGNPTWLPGYASVDDADAVEALQKEWCVVLKDMAQSQSDISRLLADKKIKVALVFGEDPIGSDTLPRELIEGLLSVDFLLVADVSMTPTAKAANVVLPLSALAATSGTMTNHERRIQSLSRAIPPAAGIESWQLICALGARMGMRFKMKYANVSEVFEEIRRAVPIYRHVVIDSSDSESIWDRGALKFPTRRAAPSLKAPIAPTRTLHIDALERRFDVWFDQVMTEARGALAPAAAE
jgi:predicted molibdopterin-dependent oxidoreductase YjgC